MGRTRVFLLIFIHHVFLCFFSGFHMVSFFFVHFFFIFRFHFFRRFSAYFPLFYLLSWLCLSIQFFFSRFQNFFITFFLCFSFLYFLFAHFLFFHYVVLLLREMCKHFLKVHNIKFSCARTFLCKTTFFPSCMNIFLEHMNTVMHELLLQTHEQFLNKDNHFWNILIYFSFVHI